MSAVKKLAVLSTALGLLTASSSGVLAQKKYDSGASDTDLCRMGSASLNLPACIRLADSCRSAATSLCCPKDVIVARKINRTAGPLSFII